MRVPRYVAILEDTEGRIAEMRACLGELLPAYEPVFFDNAAEMIGWLEEHLPKTVLISLDHDLPLRQERGGRAVDAGTGRAVADYLATQPATCPVIVHSSNDYFAPGMMCVLNDGRWPCWRVYPFDDHQWVRLVWARRIEHLLRIDMIFG